jgi:glycolate oxidase
MYKKLNDKIISNIKSIFGPANVYTEQHDMEPYASDETPGAYYIPELVVRPDEEKQIKELIKLANSESFPVVPRGGGTGLTGGSLAVSGGVVVSFERLNRIIDVDAKNRMAVTGPGVINGTLQSEAEKLGLFYPVNPASMDSCTLGGNVAESTGGANTVRYGTTRNYVTGLRAVTGEGKNWTAGGKIVKNSTDHSLIQLMCGSEGTLSIFTEITFKLIQKPLNSVWIIAPFKDIYSIPKTAEIILTKGIAPTMIELMDSPTLTCCGEYLETDVLFSDYNQLLIRFDSNDPDEIESFSKKAGEVCLSEGAEDVLIADTRREQEKIWKMRSSMHDAIKSTFACSCEEDVVVPVSNVSALIKDIYSVAEKNGFSVLIFGHMGDGNLHLNFRQEKECKDKSEESQQKVDNLRREVFETAIRLGGKLSGEHGIGISKKKYFGKFIDSEYINLLKKIKKEFDPSNILNPGKIID